MAQLRTLTGATLRDAVLLARSLPAFRGHEAGDLHCGHCGAILAAGISARTLRRDHPEGHRLILRCTCRAFNLLAARLPRRRVRRREPRFGEGSPCQAAAAP